MDILQLAAPCRIVLVTFTPEHKEPQCQNMQSSFASTTAAPTLTTLGKWRFALRANLAIDTDAPSAAFADQFQPIISTLHLGCRRHEGASRKFRGRILVGRA